MDELRPFLNERGQLTALPAKNRKKLEALYYLAERIDLERTYTEMEISDLLEESSTFHDPATLRRELFNKHLLNRMEDGRCYWKEKNIPPLVEFIAKHL